ADDRGSVGCHAGKIQDEYLGAPLILIVIIENAFKHSQSGQSSNIVIDISVEMKGGRLEFRCKNNYEPVRSLDTIASGIGLKNVRKRLELLYPHKHHLDIEERPKSYGVYLGLDLEKA